MLRKTFALPLIGLALCAGLSTAGYASDFQSVSQTGTSSLDNSNYMSIYVSGSAFIYDDPTLPPDIGGTINILGSNGIISLNAGTPIKALSCGTMILNGKTVNVANITSGHFYFSNVFAATKTLAYAKITVIQSGKGQIDLSIYEVGTGSLLATSATIAMSSGGNYAPFILNTGHTSISF